MKQLVTILTIFLLANCGAKPADNDEAVFAVADSLTPFKVLLFSGDEVVEKFEIEVYKKAAKVYAENRSPFFYFGRQTDSVWTVELDPFKVSKCRDFLNKAKSLPKGCPELSSSVKDYTISFGEESIRITGDCDWDSLDLFSLRNVLFREKLAELELKRSSLINDLDRRIRGKWYFKPLKTEAQKDEYLVLTKSREFNSECAWEFGKEESFKSSCNQVLNLAYSDKYEWQVDGDIFLQIQAGITADKNASMTLRNAGASFRVETLTDSVLKFRFLWR